MIKTTYQTPELRDSNDNIVQEGAFGKNTALSNSDNTGWIDYVVNNLEALHDTIGDSAAHLDGNGHVVEPANLAIGDEDGNRLKTSYLKLTGGTVTGTLNVQQNLKFQDNQENVFGGVYVPASSATSQYAQFYGGESVSVAGAKLTLYPDGDGRFKLDARSTDGANTYTLVTDNSGNLNWRGYPLAWKKDYLPVAGGTMNGHLYTNGHIYKTVNTGILSLNGGNGGNNGAYLNLYGKDNTTDAGVFSLAANNGTTRCQLIGKTDGTLTWRGNAIAMANNVLALSGGTMTGNPIIKMESDASRIQIAGGNTSDGYTGGARLTLYGKTSNEPGTARLMVYNDDYGRKELVLNPNGTLTWNNSNILTKANTTWATKTITLSDSQISFYGNSSSLRVNDGARLAILYLAIKVDSLSANGWLDFATLQVPPAMNSYTMALAGTGGTTPTIVDTRILTSGLVGMYLTTALVGKVIRFRTVYEVA